MYIKKILDLKKLTSLVFCKFKLNLFTKSFLLSFTLLFFYIGFTNHLIIAGTHNVSSTINESRQELKAPYLPDKIPRQSHKVSKANIVQNYGNLPLCFEINEGQSGKQVKFMSRFRDYCLFLTPNEVVVSFPHHLNFLTEDDAKVVKISNPSNTQQSKLQNPESALFRMKFIGSNSESQISGLNELPGKINYFIGNDPKEWHTNISTYAKVKYRDLYPGIDMIFYGNQRQLEYDLVVAPGTDVEIIKLTFEGADEVAIGDQGELIIQIEGNEIIQSKPFIYQEIEGVKKNISGRYVLEQELRSIGFQVATYDTSKPLIIDPVLAYSTYLGGNDNETAFDLVLDATGNVYLTGRTSSDDFPTANPLQSETTSSDFNNKEVFVTKLNPDGSALVYSTFLGGSRDDEGIDIAIDNSNNVYITGITGSEDFPVVNPFQGTKAAPIPSNDAFITKLNSTGSALIYSTYLGGSSSQSAKGIGVDINGHAYVTGSTTSEDFPTVNSGDTKCGCNSSSAFVIRLNSNGSELDYSIFLGGNFGTTVGRDITVDIDGNAYVTGSTSENSPEFPTLNPIQGENGSSLGNHSAFVTKLNPAGSRIYSTFLGNGGNDVGNCIAIDISGNAYVTGETTSENFPTVNPIQDTKQFRNDAFVAKLNSAGSALVYSTFLGGNSFDTGEGIAVDSFGNAYVTGNTISTDFLIVDPLQTVNEGNADVFVAKLDSTGSSLLYSTYIGGDGIDVGMGIAVDGSGNAYVAGEAGRNFLTINPFQETFGGGTNNDAFVLKISDTGVITTPAPTPTPTSTEECSSVKVTDSIPGFNAPRGAFFSNTVEMTIPDSFSTVVFSTDSNGQIPFSMDDWAIVTVTGPSGSEQTAILSENDAFGNPLGEQSILSNVVILESGLNTIKVELWNEFAPSGSNSSSSTIWIVPLDHNGKAICDGMTDIDIENGLLAHWKFDEGNGIFTEDSVGTNDGSLVNGAIWTEGISSSAISLDGSNDYVDIDFSDSLRFARENDFSLSVWIRSNNTSSPPGLGLAIIQATAINGGHPAWLLQ